MGRKGCPSTHSRACIHTKNEIESGFMRCWQIYLWLQNKQRSVFCHEWLCTPVFSSRYHSCLSVEAECMFSRCGQSKRESHIPPPPCHLVTHPCTYSSYHLVKQTQRTNLTSPPPPAHTRTRTHCHSVCSSSRAQPLYGLLSGRRVHRVAHRPRHAHRKQNNFAANFPRWN